MEDITQRIRYIRDNFFDGNNSKFAESIGTSEANIRNYCKNIVPKTEFLISLSTVLEINFDWLMLGIEPIQRYRSYQHDNIEEKKDNKDYIIEIQKKLIEKLEKEVKELQKQLVNKTNV